MCVAGFGGGDLGGSASRVEQSAGSNRFQPDLWRRSEWVGNETALHLGRNEAGFSATRRRGRICQEDRLARQNAGGAPDFLEKASGGR
jgi:hypothetical protein